MKIRKNCSAVILAVAALFSIQTGHGIASTALEPVKASAYTYDNSTKTVVSPYEFIENSNPDCMRELISSNYDRCFVDFYDQMQAELADQTLHCKENTESFTVSFDIEKYRYMISDSPKENNDISVQMLQFAQNVLENSPQFYWTNSHNYVKMTYSFSGDYYTKLTFDFVLDPSMQSPKARADANKQINAAVKEYKKVIKGKTDVYSQLKAINDKMVIDTYYDVFDGTIGESPNSQNAYGCLVNHLCVCNGYSKAFQLICNTLNITDTLRITGKFYEESHSVDHAWNACLVRGKWFFIDVTTNDLLKDTSGRNEYNEPDKYSDYFLLGLDNLKKDHIMNSTYSALPNFSDNDYTEPHLDTIYVDGTAYYVIANAEDLHCFSELYNNNNGISNAILTEDIDLGLTSFTPIGTKRTYNGIFNGNGHTITGLNVRASEEDVNLIGSADKAEIRDLTILSCTDSDCKDIEDHACENLIGSSTVSTVMINCNNSDHDDTNANDTAQDITADGKPAQNSVSFTASKKTASKINYSLSPILFFTEAEEDICTGLFERVNTFTDLLHYVNTFVSDVINKQYDTKAVYTLGWRQKTRIRRYSYSE